MYNVDKFIKVNMKKNIIKKNDILKFFPLIVFIFSPKIDVIAIPGYWQGIRLDDLVIFFYLIYLIFLNNFKIFPNLIQ